jgi:hypothetical protein
LRIQLDDELFVHDGLYFFARWDASNLAAEPVAIDREPVGNDLGKIKITQHQLGRRINWRGFVFLF